MAKSGIYGPDLARKRRPSSFSRHWENPGNVSEGVKGNLGQGNRWGDELAVILAEYVPTISAHQGNVNFYGSSGNSERSFSHREGLGKGERHGEMSLTPFSTLLR
jgi:hypothetical protein